MPRSSKIGLSITALLLALTCGVPGRAGAADLNSKDAAKFQQAVGKAIGYLRTKGQAPDGSFTSSAGPGITALVTTSMLRQGVPPQDPVVAKALKYLQGFVREDGGIYQEGTFYKNYETCLAILCFNAANRTSRYEKVLQK